MGALKLWDGSQWQTVSQSGPEGSVWVGTDAPATADDGDLWYDTDDTSSMLTLPLVVSDGGTGATNTAAARTNLAVPAIGQSGAVAGAPTAGTWARGDQWLDSANAMWTCTTGGTPGTWAAAQRKIQSANGNGTTDANGRLVVTFPSPYTVAPVVVGSYCAGPIGMLYVDAIAPANVTFRFFNISGTPAASAAVGFFWIAVGNY